MNNKDGTKLSQLPNQSYPLKDSDLLYYVSTGNTNVSSKSTVSQVTDYIKGRITQELLQKIEDSSDVLKAYVDLGLQESSKELTNKLEHFIDTTLEEVVIRLASELVEESEQELTDEINRESQARLAKDRVLEERLSNETLQRESEVNSLQSSLTAEVNGRLQDVTELSEMISRESSERAALTQAIVEQFGRVTSSTTANLEEIYSRLLSESSTRTAVFNELKDLLLREISERTTVLTNETMERAAAVTSLNTRLTSLAAGKADLVDGKVPQSQLPSYVDDVLEYARLATFPTTGESGKIYVAIDTGVTYRWSGTTYTEISKSLAVGETSTTAYRGDRGKIAYDHTLLKTNPHGVTKAQVGLGNVDNTADLDKPVSRATQSSITNAVANKTDKTYVDNKIATDIATHSNNKANPHNVTKSQIGLGNVNNTSDANKPVSNAVASALTLKADKTTTYTKAEVDTAVFNVTRNGAALPYNPSIQYVNGSIVTERGVLKRVSGSTLVNAVSAEDIAVGSGTLTSFKASFDDALRVVPFDPRVDDYGPILKQILETTGVISLEYNKIYPIKTAINVNTNVDIRLDGKGSTLLYTGLAVDKLIEISHHESSQNHSITNVSIDADYRSSCVLSLLSNQPNSSGQSSIHFYNSSFKNCRKSVSTQSGNIVNARGSYGSVVVENCTIENISMAPGTGISGTSGVTGLTVAHFNEDSHPVRVIIKDSTIAEITTEDLDYTMDQDGVRFFSGASSTRPRKNISKLTVINTIFKNCWGRSIKTQCLSASIKDSLFIRTSGTNFDGNVEIDFQTGNGSVSGCVFDYDNGRVPGSCIGSSTGLEYNNTGCSVTDCEVYLGQNTVLQTFFSNYPRDGGQQMIRVVGNKVFGSVFRFGTYLVNGLANKLFVHNNQVGKVLPADHRNTGALEAGFIIAKASGTVTPRGGSVELVGNTILDNTTQCAFVLDRITGNAVAVTVSANNNTGFGTSWRSPSGSNGVHNTEVIRANAFSSLEGTSSVSTESVIIPAGSTVEIQLPGSLGGLALLGLGGLVSSHMIASIVGGSFVILTSHNKPATETTSAETYVNYSITLPSTPVGTLLDIARHPDQGGKYIFRNNTASNRTLSYLILTLL